MCVKKYSYVGMSIYHVYLYMYSSVKENPARQKREHSHCRKNKKGTQPNTISNVDLCRNKLKRKQPKYKLKRCRSKRMLKGKAAKPHLEH